MDPNRTDAGPGYEATDARVGSLLRWGLILAIVTGGSFAAMTALNSLFATLAERRERPPPPMMSTSRQLPPEPRLQVQPSGDLERFRAQENAQLEGYAWVDRGAGIVRIPVERAMDLLAERGLPARRDAAGAEPAAPQASSPEEAPR